MMNNINFSTDELELMRDLLNSNLLNMKSNRNAMLSNPTRYVALKGLTAKVEASLDLQAISQHNSNVQDIPGDTNTMFTPDNMSVTTALLSEPQTPGSALSGVEPQQKPVITEKTLRKNK